MAGAAPRSLSKTLQGLSLSSGAHGSARCAGMSGSGGHIVSLCYDNGDDDGAVREGKQASPKAACGALVTRGGKSPVSPGSPATRWEAIDIKDVKVGRQIGGGGFALVYEGVWKKRRVALKALFDPRAEESTKKELMDELFVMSRLSHPNIVTLYGACTRAPNLCMVMELCERTLFSLLHGSGEGPRARAALSEKQVVGLAVQIASAFEYLHEQSPAVIHRDLKSNNVLLTSELQVKVCDFGLVGTSVTAAGTPAYMAPELLKSGLFSKKVDVYAFAVLLWEMFTQSVPFGQWEVRDIRDYVVAGNRLKLPHSGFPKQCGMLIERCWEQDPERRPEFKNVGIALGRIHSTLRDVSHVAEASQGDAFDTLSASVASSRHK
jgi:serine/threonine protein kinase